MSCLLVCFPDRCSLLSLIQLLNARLPPSHAAAPQHVYTSCPEVTQGYGGDSKVVPAQSKRRHSEHYRGSSTARWLLFTLRNSQLRKRVKGLISGYCSHKAEERASEREMPSRCQPASPFKSASVELIRAPEIKMRGCNERLLEIRSLLAVGAAV